MSKAYKCDRCGKFFDIPDKIDRCVIGGEPVWKFKVFGRYDAVKCSGEYELCPNCANSFGNWLTEVGDSE